MSIDFTFFSAPSFFMYETSPTQDVSASQSIFFMFKYLHRNGHKTNLFI